jgi:hypothetical protein
MTLHRHQCALNDILAANNGIAPADLQEQIDVWEPKSMTTKNL